MFKRRNSASSGNANSNMRPSFEGPPPTPALPPSLPPLPSDPDFLSRMPTLTNKGARVKVPSANPTSIPQSNSSNNFSRPSSDSVRYTNSNNNHNNNNNNNNNYNYSNGIPRSSATSTMTHPPPLPSHAINQYKNNRSSTYSTHSIASLYPSTSYSDLIPPVPSFNNNVQSSASSMTKSTSLPNIRRLHKISPSYNIILVGARSSGKSSYIKTLIRSVNLVKNSSMPDALARIESFEGSGNSTKTITLEIVTDNKEKLNLTLVDTSSLDIFSGNSPGSVGHEFEVERQVDGIMRIIEDRFEETFQAENETFRAASSKVQDSHLHFCLYFLHPQSLSSSPTSSPSSSAFLHPLDLRTLKRLSRSVNILPILSRSDELTINQLNQWKEGVKKELNRCGLELNPFVMGRGMELLDQMIVSKERTKAKSIRRGRSPVKPGEMSNENGNGNGSSSAIVDSGSEGEEDGEEEEVEVKVIKIKRSASRVFTKPRGLKLQDYETDERGEREEEVTNWEEVLPFAIVSPETFEAEGKRFVRVFKYGTIDVLNPMHSDFTALRKALFSTSSMKVLKESTKQDKYEPFRTSKLLARRGTNRGGAEEEAILRDLSRI